MDIRQFTEADASEYWKLRLGALKECPEAFGASYEEEKDKLLSTVEQRIKESSEATDSEFILYNLSLQADIYPPKYYNK